MNSFPGLSYHDEQSAPLREKPKEKPTVTFSRDLFLLLLPFSKLKFKKPRLHRNLCKQDITEEHYLSFLFLLCLHDVQALHEAGDTLLQAVDGVVLRIVATEAVAQAAKGISDKLQVTGLRAKMKCWWYGQCSIASYTSTTELTKIKERGSQKSHFYFCGGKFSSSRTAPLFFL
jgi:hypothetical protein